MKQIDNAILYASRAHEGMKRKGFSQPYFFHPLEVLSLAYLLTEDDDILCAAVLHDTVEDTFVTIEDIKNVFGDKIAAIVGDESEDKREGMSKLDSWTLRKEEAIEKLRNTDNIGSKIVCLCDKVSNLRSFHLMQYEYKEKMWDNFNMKDPLKHYWYYNSLKEAMPELKDTVVYKEMEFLIDTIFGQYIK